MSKISTPKTEEYRTSDFWLASYLKASGNRLKEVERVGGRCVFIFEVPEKDTILLKFHNGDLTVKVQDFINGMNALKAIIHS